MRTHLTAILSALLLSTIAPACLDADDTGDEVAELDDSPSDEKSDRPDLATTPVETDSAPQVSGERVGVIKSKTAWKNVFGTTAPASINFSHEWVAYYAAGARSTGGYNAAITHVRLSDTGLTLKISALLEEPGLDCLVTEGFTAPYAVVKFNKPASAPSTNRYSTTTTERSCNPSCDGETVYESTYISLGMGNGQCHLPVEHCITHDVDACPQVAPVSPSFCPNGTVKTEPYYVASADGEECQLYRMHCVTNDASVCPAIGPISPSFCPNGIIKTVPRFFASPDGMECTLPTVYCVVSDPGCPID